MKKLPYRAVTSGGAVLDVAFELHPQTVSPERVALLVTALLNSLDQQLEGRSPAANGDVLQAVAMLLALRAAMLPASRDVREHLARDRPVVERRHHRAHGLRGLVPLARDEHHVAGPRGRDRGGDRRAPVEHDLEARRRRTAHDGGGDGRRVLAAR